MKTDLYKCPSCGGDGIETCHNPDHRFLAAMDGSMLNANESACPCCGHREDHKIEHRLTAGGKKV